MPQATVDLDDEDTPKANIDASDSDTVRNTACTDRSGNRGCGDRSGSLDRDLRIFQEKA